MKIVNHLLFNNSNNQVEFRSTPNKSGKYTPQFLIMHYTAATEAKGSINWFLFKDAKASAHLIIDRDGTITQFAPFDVVCWHAGKSKWNGLDNLNKYSIGIELVNGGRLTKTGNGWICPVDKKFVAEEDVIIAQHKNESSSSGWQVYTKFQLQVATEVAALLVKTYNLKDVLGHEDIAPFRKSDPGPAFPMAGFKSRAIGRKDEAGGKFFTNTAVNIRSGAGTEFAPLTDSLPKNTEVMVLRRQGNWSFVEVLGTVHGLNDLEGWVASKFIIQQ